MALLLRLPIALRLFKALRRGRRARLRDRLRRDRGRRRRLPAILGGVALGALALLAARRKRHEAGGSPAPTAEDLPVPRRDDPLSRIESEIQTTERGAQG